MMLAAAFAVGLLMGGGLGVWGGLCLAGHVLDEAIRGLQAATQAEEKR